MILCEDIIMLWDAKNLKFKFCNIKDEENYSVLGFYKNEEKADKILNEIEEFITLEKKGVYHMPEDESE